MKRKENKRIKGKKKDGEGKKERKIKRKKKITE